MHRADDNIRHLNWDIFWFGLVAGSTLAYLSIYATRQGASGFQISLLMAGGAIINMLLSIPAGRWLEGRSLPRVCFRSVVLSRLGYVILVPLPWLLSGQLEIWVIIGLTLIGAIPMTVLNVAFPAMFAEMIPAEQRIRVIGRRSAISAVSMTFSTLLCGQLLDWLPATVNYPVVFGIGVLGSMLSAYHVGQLRLVKKILPASADQPGGAAAGIADAVPAAATPIAPAQRHALLRLDLLRGPFGTFMLAYLVFYACQYFPLSLFPIFLVRNLQISDGTIGLGNAAFYAVMFGVSMRLDKITRRFGNRRTMVAAGLVFCAYPILVGFAWDATLYMAASLIGGAIYAILAASFMSRLMERSAENDRPAYMALHNLVLNLGILAGSMSGPLAAEWIGLQPAIFLSAGLRFLAGVLLVFWA